MKSYPKIQESGPAISQWENFIPLIHANDWRDKAPFLLSASDIYTGQYWMIKVSTLHLGTVSMIYGCFHCALHGLNTLQENYDVDWIQ